MTTSMHLWDALVRSGTKATLHAWTGREFEHHPWAEVVAGAHQVAFGLRRAGLRPGDRVAAVLENSVDVVKGVLGVWLAGGVVASLPIAARGMKHHEYWQQLVQLREHVGAELLVVDDARVAEIPEALVRGFQVRGWQSLPASGTIDPCPPELDQLAFIQYSSGSTSTPKGCMLDARAIAAQLEIIADMSGSTPGEEIVATWLPLSHDMGLFGTLLFAWAWGFDLVMSTPRRFTVAPRSWFRDCADFGATLTVATNTALDHAARFQGRARLERPLQLRVCVVGAEPVRWDTVTALLEVFGPYGLEPQVLMPAYGLAEATLAVTATGVTEEPKRVTVDAMGLAEGEVRAVPEDHPRATKVVSVGRPCKGVGLRLADPDRISEIYIRTPSLAQGYFGDEERTRARFVDGEFRTGDLGFLSDGELYMVGRLDDMLSISGRNVYAHEIESAICTLPHVREGCCAVVELVSDRTTRLIALLEMKRRNLDHDAVASAVAGLMTSKAGIDLDECMFLRQGVLPKTPSGKVQRFRCRQMLVSGDFEPVAHIRLRPAPPST